MACNVPRETLFFARNIVCVVNAGSRIEVALFMVDPTPISIDERAQGGGMEAFRT
jgi:hypothetical protein